jgi:hypothetical protein
MVHTMAVTALAALDFMYLYDTSLYEMHTWTQPLKCFIVFNKSFAFDKCMTLLGDRAQVAVGLT